MSLSALWIILSTLVVPLPYGTDRRLRSVPWVTYTLIGLNVLAYLTIVVYSRSHPQYDIFGTWGLVPGAPRPITLLTSLFVHVSPGHLFWNMLFLWVFGPHVEDALGRISFVSLYFGGGIAAGLLHMAIAALLSHTSVIALSPLVGASGAISAILAPFAVRFHRAQIRLLWVPGLLFSNSWGQLEVPALAGVGIWLLQTLGGALQALLFPQSGGTAYWAHLGGFAFGLVAAELTDLFREGRQEYLLEDARAEAARGQDALGAAVHKFRGFLEQQPQDPAVHAELARVLVQRSVQRAGTEDEDREEAADEILAAIRLWQKRDNLVEASRLCAYAQTLRLPLPLTSRERLHLAIASAERGDPKTAVLLLRALIRETPEAAEDEMARLKLGQLLVKMAPQEAHEILADFLERYPESEWSRLARGLRAEAAHLAGQSL